MWHLLGGYGRVAFVNPDDELTMISIDEIISRERDRIPTEKFTPVNDAIAWMNSDEDTKHVAASPGDVDAKLKDKKINHTYEETLLLRYLAGSSLVITIAYGILDYFSGDYLDLPQVLIGFTSFTICIIIIHETDSCTIGKRGLLILLEIIVVAGFFFQGGLRGLNIFDFLNLAVVLATVTSGREKKGFFFSCLLLVLALAFIETYRPAWITKRETQSPVWFEMIGIGIRAFTLLYTGYRYFKNDNIERASIHRKLTHAHLEIVAYNRQLKGVVEVLIEEKRKTELANLESVLERAQTLESNKKLAEANEEIKDKNELIHANNQTLERIIRELKVEQEKALKANGELETLNAELNAKNELIAAANEAMERRIAERTVGMIAMDRKIEQYAFFTSHELRGPLARILGLANLMKLDVSHRDIKADELIPLYIDKLFHSAVELDIQVRRAAGILNEVEIKQESETEFNVCVDDAGDRSLHNKT